MITEKEARLLDSLLLAECEQTEEMAVGRAQVI